MATIQKTLINKNIGTKVSAREYQKIIKLVKSGMYLSVSDFLRDAVREKLDGIEIIELRDVDRETAKKEILDYYKKNERAYPSDVADDLRLDWDLVWEITEELEKEGQLEVID
ncbi:MAG: hypothetical protein ACE5KT_04610 [Methanosarcinales archaeon]